MDILSDSKRALRRVLAHRGLTAVVVATLAAGIGANATVWSWMEALVRRPLPGVARQEELTVLVSNQGGGNVSQLDFRDFAGLDRVFAGGLMTQMTFASLEVDDRPEWVNTEIVSAGFFDLLGAQAKLGRFFRPDEDRTPGGDAVLVISERLWRRRFGADPRVVGRVVELNRHGFTIVGVAAAPFRGSMSAMAFDAWTPSSMIWEVRNQRLEGRSARGWHNLFRLRPGVSVALAAAAVETLNAQLAMAYPETNRGIRHRLVAMPDCPDRRAGGHGPRAAPAPGRQPRRPADRRGQRGQPVARRRRRTAEGARDPARPRRQPGPPRPRSDAREPRAGARGRRARPRPRDTPGLRDLALPARRRRPASSSTSRSTARRSSSPSC